MGFFSANLPKRVTESEFTDIMHNLYGKLDESERVEVEKLFRADLYEPGSEAGISPAEYDLAMQWLAENTDKHVLEANDIVLIKKYFTEHLRD